MDTSSITLLLVDEDRALLDTFGEALRLAGYQVLTAESGEAALHLARDRTVDLAVLDIRLPGMSGLEVSRTFRDIPIPVVFLTALRDDELVAEAVRQGALGYLIKPVDVDRLIPSIRTAVAGGRELTALRISHARLSQALDIERLTRTAVGILIERHGLNRDQSFEALRTLARSQRRRVGELAEELIRAAEMLNRPAAGNAGTPPASAG